MSKQQPDLNSSDEIVVLGRLSGVYGVKGWLKVYSWTNKKQDILGYNPWLISSKDGWRQYNLEAGKPHGKGIIAKLEGIDDRDSAQTMLQKEVGITREQLPVLHQGEFYWDDLIGLQVINLQGDNLGRVASILETGANDVLVVKGVTERLIPFAWPSIVTDVSVKSGTITVDWLIDY